MHIAVLIESRSVPALRICIDERCGMFYLESPLYAHMGDWMIRSNRSMRRRTWRSHFPAVIFTPAKTRLRFR